MATLRDIATHLGVSESTVSLAMNGKGRIAEATRQRVRAYAAAIEYRPNQMARGLKLRRALTIGVVVPDISNEFYALLFKAIDSRLAPEGFTPILFNIGSDAAREAEFVGQLQSASVDGMIVATAGSEIYSSLPAPLLRRIVFVDNMPVGAGDWTFVGSDNFKASYTLTKHLIERGHTRIATITGSMGESSAQQRLNGLAQCLSDHGIQLRDEWIARTNFQYEDGIAKARRLLSRDDRPTAVIAQNNVLGYAAINVARQLHLTVPEDLALACFDHLDTYGFMRPAITTVLQPLEEIAELACQLLTANGGAPQSAHHYLETSFRAGETT